MKTYDGNPQENKSPAAANDTAQKHGNAANPQAAAQFVDNRPEAHAMRRLQEMADNSPRVKQMRAWQEKIDNSPRVKQLMQFQEMANNSKNPEHIKLREMQAMADSYSARRAAQFFSKGPGTPEPLQRQETPEEDELQLKRKADAPAQRQENPGEEEEIQLKPEAGTPEPVQKKENKTGLPDNLKAGVENLSGYSMDDVRVHYNSGKPAQLNAHAYTQGTEIHVAPGQEQHLPHEAWHVVQQKQGRVQPTMQLAGVAVNDDTGLEREADGMGSVALTTVCEAASQLNIPSQSSPPETIQRIEEEEEPLQGKFEKSTSTPTQLQANDEERRVGTAHHSAAAEYITAIPITSITQRNCSGILQLVGDARTTTPVVQRQPGKRRQPSRSCNAKKNKSSQVPKQQASVVPDSGPPRLVFEQFGGQTGSQAGDAFVMKPGKSRRLFVIDCGQKESFQNRTLRGHLENMGSCDPKSSDFSEWETDSECSHTQSGTKKKKGKSGHNGAPPKKRRKILMLTHNHADHIGEEIDRKGFDVVFEGSSKVTPKPPNPQNVEKSGEELFAWREKNKDNPLVVRCHAIVPSIVNGGEKNDDNAKSLGALMTVDQKSEDKTEQLFTFLTLGDMTEKAALTPINHVVNTPVDLLKLPHHGSANNLGAVPNGVIGENTRILISGYTMTEANKLLNFLKDDKHKHGGVYFLFSNKKDEEKLTKDAGETWKNLSKENCKTAKDYRVTVGEKGNVIHEFLDFNGSPCTAQLPKEPDTDEQEMSDKELSASSPLASEDEVAPLVIHNQAASQHSSASPASPAGRVRHRPQFIRKKKRQNKS